MRCARTGSLRISWCLYQCAVRSDLRNRCLESTGSDSSRIPISLYFITSHLRARIRVADPRRYSGEVLLSFVQDVSKTQGIWIFYKKILSNFYEKKFYVKILNYSERNYYLSPEDSSFLTLNISRYLKQ